jgi:hypothetical protein
MSTTPPLKTQKLLAFLSGGRCAYPGCGRHLWTKDEEGHPASVCAVAAHIRGEKPGSARYDASMTDGERMDLVNLMYLCPTHHDEIDKNESIWTVEKLVQAKQTHEASVQASLGATMGEVSCSDLEVVVRGIVTGEYADPTDFTITDISQKMRVNQLSAQTGMLLRIGMASSREVARYLERLSEVDANVGERLKAAFQRHYREQHSGGLRGDALFEAMREFATSGFGELRLQAAGLAVLAYLFEACEVFEK